MRVRRILIKKNDIRMIREKRGFEKYEPVVGNG